MVREYSFLGSSGLDLRVTNEPLLADCVEKVENRTTPKISQKSIFGRLHCCKAPWRRYDGPWSFLSETMWSLTSMRAKRIGGPKKFRPSGEKDFFNKIGTSRTWSDVRLESANRSQADVIRRRPVGQLVAAPDSCGLLWGLILLGHPHIELVAHWQASITREPPKTKAELRQMLAEAVRNTEPNADHRPKHSPKAKKDQP